MARTRKSRRTTGAIRALPSGRYQARARTPDGRLIPAPRTFRTRADADAWLASVTTDQTRGEWIDPEVAKTPFDRYARDWMAGKAALAPKTRDLYDYLLDRLLLPTFRDVAMADITPARVRVWRAKLLEAERPGPSTVAKAYRLLSAIMTTAVVDNVVLRNPCLEKGAGVERAPEMRIATPEQVAAIADSIEARYRALVLTAAYAGCRWGELVGLKQRNLDLLHARLTVAEQVVELRGGQVLRREPKTAAGRRIVHLPAGLVKELSAHLDRFVRTDPDALVFPAPGGNVLRSSNFRSRHWLGATATAGVSGLRFHDLRHVAGTLATVSGATIREVQGRLGHASPAAAYRYQHVLDNRDAEIAEKLDVVMQSAARAGAKRQPGPTPLNRRRRAGGSAKGVPG